MKQRSERPEFSVTPALLRTYSEILDVPIREDELELMADRVRAILADVSRLWDVDVTDVEMALTFAPMKHD